MDTLLDSQVESNVAGEAPAPADEPYVGLALKWRPKTFDEIVGQRQVSETLKNAIAQGRIAQAYLFCGPRGVGKTSTARILARAINCEKGPTPEPCGKCTFCRAISAGSDMDVVEIDGASNNKVDDVRELREAVNFTPFAARYKVYIIDEVHMLSTGAFNALLKTLEEPPERVKFIFATTEPHRVPATIRSRCQVCNFSQITEADIVGRLETILAREPSITVAPDEKRAVLETIAHYAEGSMRDALVAFDQVAALGLGSVSLKDVQDLLGLVDSDACLSLLAGLCTGKTAELLQKVDELVNAGRDLERVARQLVKLVRDGLILKAGAAPDLVRRPDSERRRLTGIVGGVSLAQMVNISQVLVGLEEQMRSGVPVRFALELAFIKLTALGGATDLGELIKKIEAMSRSGHAETAGATPLSRPAAAPGTPPAMRLAERTTPVPVASAVMAERSAAPVAAPRVVPAAVHLPATPDAAANGENSLEGNGNGVSADAVRVSESVAEFESESVLSNGIALDDEPGTMNAAPHLGAPADPRAWLRETLSRDPSLAEAVEVIKQMFSAREVALDGIPL
ncbi:MAG: DNA polymerase III subunit gamma/tau [Candidatus Sumerlaeia bacterium]|nr:DNA polymerase III subunit gamma/tau [Candidatus Sumerlaeia bacterium]